MTDSENLNLLGRSTFFPTYSFNIQYIYISQYIGVDKASTYTTKLWAPFHAGSRTYRTLNFFVLFRNLFHSSETRQYFGNLIWE